MALDWKQRQMSQYLRVTATDGCALLQIPGASCFRAKLQSDISIPKLLLMNPQKCRSGDDWNPLTFWKTCYSALYTDFTSSATTTTSAQICFKTNTSRWSPEVHAACRQWVRVMVIVRLRSQSHRTESNRLTIQLEPKEFRACLCGSKATSKTSI